MLFLALLRWLHFETFIIWANLFTKFVLHNLWWWIGKSALLKLNYSTPVLSLKVTFKNCVSVLRVTLVIMFCSYHDFINHCMALSKTFYIIYCICTHCLYHNYANCVLHYITLLYITNLQQRNIDQNVLILPFVSNLCTYFHPIQINCEILSN